MEISQQQNHEDGNGSSKCGGGGGGFLVRQSSSRWTPTTDQIRILKSLYYNDGVRSPSAEQIQKISARLRQYGKIEGKNVFYWFQNHKARERQKKRFVTTTSDHTTTTTMQRPGLINPTAWKPPHHHHHQDHQYQSFNNYSHGNGANNGVGQMGHFGYGGVNFRDCGSSEVNNGHNFGWVGHVDPYPSTYNTLFEKRPLDDEEEEDNIEVEHHQEIHSQKIETLPLFPVHAEDINGCFSNSFKPNYSGGGGGGSAYYSGWFCPDGGRGGSRASLELRLNSYSRNSPDSHA
ncbi:hypothetical protein CsatB_024724 [Cannabis sativa]